MLDVRVSCIVVRGLIVEGMSDVVNVMLSMMSVMSQLCLVKPVSVHGDQIVCCE